ncbi:MAG: two-component system response regulator, partial [Campylobacterales bacterium]|nr:two-component system response regulator [Campylobacterales bacterium]
MLKTVLLVDDSKTVLRILENELLKEGNLEVLKAENFEETKKLIAFHPCIHVAI